MSDSGKGKKPASRKKSGFSKIENLIEKMTFHAFGKKKIISVESRPDVSWDGEDVIRIQVVIDDTDGKLLEGRKVVNWMSDIRDALVDMDVMALPLPFYATKSELEFEKAHG